MTADYNDIGPDYNDISSVLQLIKMKIKSLIYIAKTSKRFQEISVGLLTYA